AQPADLRGRCAACAVAGPECQLRPRRGRIRPGAGRRPARSRRCGAGDACTRRAACVGRRGACRGREGLRDRLGPPPRRPRQPARRARRAAAAAAARPATRQPARATAAGRGRAGPRAGPRTRRRRASPLLRRHPTEHPMTTEINPNAGARAPEQSNGRRRRALLAIAGVTAAALAAWGLWYLAVGRWHVDTDDAYVQGNVVGVTPQVGGTVVAIHAEDGMRVEAGQVLVELDPSDATVALEQAKANLAATVRQVRGLYAAVDAGQAGMRARQVAVERARADVARRTGLVASGAVSQEELAHARNELAAAQAALATAREDLVRNRALVDATTVASQPQVQAAAAQLRAAYLALQRARIVAPVSGYVAQRRAQLGERVQPGAALMSVIPLEQVWVEANFKETQLEKMRLGQP